MRDRTTAGLILLFLTAFRVSVLIAEDIGSDCLTNQSPAVSTPDETDAGSVSDPVAVGETGIQGKEFRPMPAGSGLVEIEFGAGHLITLTGEYRYRHLGAGLSAAFDTSVYKYRESTFREYLYNISCVGAYHTQFPEKSSADVVIYSRVGYELYSLSPYWDQDFFIGPGVKFFYKYIFADLSFPILIGSGSPLFLVQLGIGLRFPIGPSYAR
jgi:hypothetical protein